MRPIPIALLLLLAGCHGLPAWEVDDFDDDAHGAEDIAFAPDGSIWSGAKGGGLLHITDDGDDVERIEADVREPLGVLWLDDGPSGVGIVVADAGRGLFFVRPDGATEPLTREVDGEPLELVNGVALAPDGSIYFTESSRRHELDEITASSLLGDDSGRLLRYDPAGRTTRVVADGFVFANGVAVVDGGDAVLVAETFARRISKLHVRGPSAGMRETWVDDLPGYPDNLDADDRGIVWVALYAEHEPGLDVIRSIPMLPRLLVYPVRAFEQVKGSRLEPKAVGRFLGFDQAGKLVHDLRDPHPEFAPLTGVRARGDELFLVAPSAEPSIGAMKRPVVEGE